MKKILFFLFRAVLFAAPFITTAQSDGSQTVPQNLLDLWNQLLAEAPPQMSNKERATWVQETYANRYG